MRKRIYNTPIYRSTPEYKRSEFKKKPYINVLGQDVILLEHDLTLYKDFIIFYK